MNDTWILKKCSVILLQDVRRLPQIEEELKSNEDKSSVIARYSDPTFLFNRMQDTPLPPKPKKIPSEV
jgi:hypothetical protein